VRAALVRDFGRDVLEPAGAEVGGSSTATPAPSPSATGGTGGRTVTLPVTADTSSAAGRSLDQRGWQLAHWAVANASELHIARVTYAGREWFAGNTAGEWRTAAEQGTAGAERDADAVRIVTMR
jgi:hypothetical protein